MRALPGPGIEPVSPALAGGFFTTEPPGTPCTVRSYARSVQLIGIISDWGRAGFWGLIGNGTPLQYSYLENPMDGGAWWAAVHGVAESWTRLSDFTFTFHFHALEKEMATHSNVLAWRIPGTAEPGRLLSVESHRVRHD